MNNPFKKSTHNLDNLDANVLQNMASNPNISAWVGASAGSGKTKVLTDRILRLLLPDQNDLKACAPHKILALTFTKNAASEMMLRINERLSQWAIINLTELRKELENLIGYEPTTKQIETAQKLFAVVIDAPGGLKIMTIHSFCQSILGRFPLEAGLNPNFKPLEEDQAAILLKQAQNNVFKHAKANKGSPLGAAIYNLVLSQNEDQFSDLLDKLISERRQIKNILEKNNFDINSLYEAICQKIDIPASLSIDKVLFEACDSKNFDEKGLWTACKSLSTGTESTDKPQGIEIQKWLEKSQLERAKKFEFYKKVFLTDKDEIRKTIATKKIYNLSPDCEKILKNEAQRVFNLIYKIQAIKIAELTRDLFLVGQEILKEYQILKEQISALDFDDLILRTLDLLQGKTMKMAQKDVAPWVRYKLDQGIDHILVDEAQDTNPEQWEIIQALSDDFFDDQSGQNIERTLFVVGDKKQSIFSFQRANPEKFNYMKIWFEEKIKSNQKPFDEIDFIVSFRSVSSVLQLVDAIFSIPDIRKGLDIDDIRHVAHRRNQAGLVELWPLFEQDEKQKLSPWEPPIEIIDNTSSAAQLAEHIGDKIKNWIDVEDLQSYDRKIQAGDIMILVRRRNSFVNQLVRALKTRNIPVSGVDRMVLSDQLVVQDLCASAQFALLPEDDLILACLLKSPFIGWNEEQLFDVCYKRKSQSLWANVKKNADKQTKEWLEHLIHNVGKMRPYEFFSWLLQTQCPAHESGLKAIKSRLGEECLDPLDEFLNIALEYDADNIPTLQNFIQSQLSNITELKRQMEEESNAVRIMTVHGAKGLQAPIVILPDTVINKGYTPKKNILWPHQSDKKLPYFIPNKNNLPTEIDEALANVQKKEDEEYRRLFYVALTRAEERLYIGGYKGTKGISENCWYEYAKEGFKKLPDTKQLEDGTLVLKNSRQGKPDNTHKNKNFNKYKGEKAPKWLLEAVKEDPTAPRVLTPSRPLEDDDSALSPLKAVNDYRFLQGNITHKLLQILPDMPHDKRQTAAEKYVRHPAHNLPNEKQKTIVSETLKILNDPRFSALFGEGSMAEVPITGLMNNRMISGQIDRLLVTQDEVLIVDYKTNRPPPQKVEDVPEIYRSQMKAYAGIMQDIYKDKTIRTALIWTDGGVIMELTDLV